MPLSWNEIKHRAIKFSRDWKGAVSEKSERQTFWNEFFDVFGVRRRTVASFEEPVRKLSGNWGFIDLFWPGKVLVEHKSAGQDLDKAHAQGMDYIRGLIDSGRAAEAPRWLIVSDFQRIAIHDLEPEAAPEGSATAALPASVVFPLADLHRHIRHFAFIAGYRQHRIDPEDPANFQATELMARLHDALYDGGYRGHDLCQFLVRLLFCFFADDTGIFPPDAFKLFLHDHTAPDGSDLGAKLDRFFSVLNEPEDQRSNRLDEDLAQFPYINGDLFAERLRHADFDQTMRRALLDAAEFRWERISPAIFGSLFQTVFDHEDDRKRRQLGAHYTTETNILKVVRSLFLDELRAEFDAARKDKSGRGPGRLRALQDRLASLCFLDPACGCGNFLVITYRELRRLELEILVELHRDELGALQGELTLDVNQLSRVDVDQMYGIELEEFPARIAEVALWLADHQANVALSEAFGQFYKRIPLRKSPQIVVANALRVHWSDVISPAKCSYILGNPPFVGKHYQSPDQKAEIANIFSGVKGSGVLDFVTCWHALAARFITQTNIRVGFVSTNSICQGEQAGILWHYLFQKWAIKIHFAHRTFSWQSEARGKAHVHCVIVGFGSFDRPTKQIFDYGSDPEAPNIVEVANIGPYLFEGPDRAVISRTKPITKAPEMTNGSKPVEGGNLILSLQEKLHLEATCPNMAQYIKPLIGSEEFINGEQRWCIWLENVNPAEIRACSEITDRIIRVREMRLASTDKTTNRNASRPSVFAYIRQPKSPYLAIPEVSSENRPYVPMAILQPDVICTNKIQFIPNPTLWDFGVITSEMHMSWMRHIGGRLKSDYSYSKNLVYNNFPWPASPTEAQVAAVEQAAQAVLDARAQFPDATLADLYDPVTMPPALAKAHETLDRAVERCYRREPFPHDRARVEHLFALYEQLTAPLAPAAKAARRKRGT